MEISKFKLQNGPESVFVHMPDSTLTCIQVWFRVGSALENKKDLGMAHFLEHMFFKGSKKFPGSKLVKEVEDFGGEINAFTSFEYTCYYINSPNEYLKKSLNILLDMMTNPLFKKEDIPAEREVVFEEHLQSIDNPNSYQFHELQKLAFLGGHARPILGTANSIKNFKKTQLVSFKNKFLNTSNALLIIAGNIKKKDQVISLISKYKWPKGPESNYPPFKVKNKAATSIHAKDVNSSTLTLAIQGQDYTHHDIYQEDLAINCLGHGETSRFFKKLIHQTSQANSCSGSTMYFVKGSGHFIKIVGPSKNLKAIYKIILSTFEEVIKEGFSKEEVEKIKNQYVASKVYDKESLETYSFSLGQGWAQNKDIYSEELFVENIKKCTTQEVNKAIGKILTRPIFATLQIPLKENLKNCKQDLTSFHKKMGDIKANIKDTTCLKKMTPSKFDKSTKVVSIGPNLKLLYRKNNLTPTFVFYTYIKGGLAYETDKNNGYHSMLSSLITKGYDKIPYQKLQATLEDYSAHLGGLSGKNAYGLTLHGQSIHAPELFKHFFGSLLRPDITKSDLEREKEMVSRLIDNQKKDPIKQCFKAFNSIIFKNHPYSRELTGTQENIKKINPSLLKKLHNKNLNENEMILTYCGDLELETLLSYLDPYLKDLNTKKKKNESTNFKLNKASKGEKIFIPFDREQSQIMVGIPGFSITEKEDLYLKILTTHLNGQSSDLFVQMRDHLGLCYSVSPLHFSAINGGYWGIYMASSNEKRDLAIKEIMKLINKLQKKGLSASEFKIVKQVYYGQTQLTLQTNDDYANAYTVPELHHLGLDYIYLINQRIKKLSLKEFNDFIKTYFDKEWNVVVVGK